MKNGPEEKEDSDGVGQAKLFFENVIMAEKDQPQASVETDLFIFQKYN